eukprot:gene15038-16591_t
MALVQEANWSKVEDKNDPNKHDLLCPKHNSERQGGKKWLIHVIDGFVIEESNVPFQVEGAEENNDPNAMDVPKNSQFVSNMEGEEQNSLMDRWGAPESNQFNHSVEEPHIPVFPTNCKFCGGPLPEERAFWGKRFCSKSCGKRYNAGYSYRARRGMHKRGTPRGRGRGFGKLRRPRDENREQEFEMQPEIHKSPANEEPRQAFEFGEQSKWPYQIEGLSQEDFEEDLFDGVEPMMKYASIPAVLWSPEDVVSFISEIPGCQRYAERFLEEEIDGPALMLLKEEHLIQTMGLKLGPALKISAHLRSFKSKYGVKYMTKYLSSPL